MTILEPMGWEWLGQLGGIVLVDLVLSGDNALVIGAAAAGLAKEERWWAIVLGGGGAVVLRILFTILASFLLRWPLLQAIGGVILVYIAIRLLMDRNDKEHAAAKKEGAQAGRKGFVAALLTILVADVAMSLDNILAVGALAAGHLPLLIIGLLLSIALLLVGSALIASLIGRLPWLLDVASLVLAWTAANMILHDLHLKPFFETQPWTGMVIPALCLGIVVLVDIYLWWRVRGKRGD
jgi:YjbE family integral membrane protein